MSLILCRKEPVTRPYWIEPLGIHIYSSQELCYVIYNHALLVMDDFINEGLITFIREQLDMPFLAAKLEKWQAAGESSDDMLLIILQECFYYQTTEINKFRSQLLLYRKMHPAQLKKERADCLFGLCQYGRAISIYEKILQMPKDGTVDELFLGKVWNNLGSSYARMFQLNQAWKALEIAYSYTKDQSVLKRLYHLTKLDQDLVLVERYQTLITPELQEKWDKELEEAALRAKGSRRLEELEHLFEKDPIKRTEGARKLVYQWRQEYRSML